MLLYLFNNNRRRLFFPSGLLVAGLLAGCARPSSPPAAPTDGPNAVSAAPLRETRWVVRQLAGQPVTVAANARELYVVLRADGMADGDGGCNRFRGTFSAPAASAPAASAPAASAPATPDALTFSPLLSTRMACPALATETAFSSALQQTQTYRISGDTLRLFGPNAALLARLEAVYLR